MRFVAFLAAILLTAQTAHGFEPQKWMERCLEHSATMGDDAFTVESKCLTTPADVCLFSEDPVVCQASYIAFLDEMYSETQAELPNEITSDGFSTGMINRMLEQSRENESDLCPPEYLESAELRSKTYPNALSVKDQCSVLNKIVLLSQMLMVRRMIDRVEARE